MFSYALKLLVLTAAIAAPFSFRMLAADNLSHGDSSFLKDAAEGGMDEVKLGELAMQNASSQEVKDFGRRMMKDHGKMGDEVKSMAMRKNVNLPGDIGLKDKASYQLLSAKHGVEFDKSYISDMVKDHRNDIAAFEKEVASASDPDVKDLAMKALPTLREHLRMAEKIAADLGVQ